MPLELVQSEGHDTTIPLEALNLTLALGLVASRDVRISLFFVYSRIQYSFANIRTSPSLLGCFQIRMCQQTDFGFVVRHTTIRPYCRPPEETVTPNTFFKGSGTPWQSSLLGCPQCSTPS
jgi:hypothetical protein